MISIDSNIGFRHIQYCMEKNIAAYTKPVFESRIAIDCTFSSPPTEVYYLCALLTTGTVCDKEFPFFAYSYRHLKKHHRILPHRIFCYLKLNGIQFSCITSLTCFHPYAFLWLLPLCRFFVYCHTPTAGQSH